LDWDEESQRPLSHTSLGETMERLTVLYDGGCALCLRCRDFLASSPQLVPLDLLPSDSPIARERFGTIPWLGAELVVVDEAGHVWVGAAAFIMCLWALAEHRELSYTLSNTMLAPLAERFFVTLSSRRKRVAAWLHPSCDDATCRVPPAPVRSRPVYR
jgi:predicted DCC family thiol-disulfide oxidoreductase YuxK